jgi:hypothetical protein
MSRDEFDERIRALNAERARPEPPKPLPPGVALLLRQLVATLHSLYTTPPDPPPSQRGAA